MPTANSKQIDVKRKNKDQTKGKKASDSNGLKSWKKSNRKSTKKNTTGTEIQALFLDRSESWGEVVSEHWPQVQASLSQAQPLRETLFLGSRVGAIGWALPTSLASTFDLVAKYVGKAERGKKLTQAISEMSVCAESLSSTFSSGGDAQRTQVALSALVVAHGLRSTISSCDDLQWRRLVETVRSVINQGQLRLGESCPFFDQLVAVELPLTFAWQLADLGLYSGTASSAVQFFNGTKEHLDSDGMPNAETLSVFGPLVASWSRSCELVEKLKLKIDLDLRLQLEGVPEQFFRMHSGDKRLLLSPADTISTDPNFVEHVLKFLSVDPGDRQVAQSMGLLKEQKTKKGKKAKKEKQGAGKPKSKGKKVKPVVDAGFNCVSEWGESAVFRADWKSKACALALGYSKSPIKLEFGSRCPLISGLVETVILIDDVEAAFDGAFEIVCEFYDDEVSFVEFELELNDGAAVLNRQFLFSLEESFLFIHDIVTTKQPRAKIDYHSTLPLAGDIEVMPETETRELYLLRHGAIESLVLPLALPEWNVGRCEDSITFDRKSISLNQTINVGEQGGGLSAPLFFDLNAKRSRKKRTWRQLTVGETRELVPKSDAVAYRVQLDKTNWVFYRAIRNMANRTFFGENFFGDFFAGRLEKCGTVTPLVQVEE